MIEYRTARAEERDACVRLANEVFGFDFETFIPKVYRSGSDCASIHKVAADEQGRLHAMTAVLPQSLQISGVPLKSGIVGTVAVHTDSRGQGHMKALMQLWLDEMQGAYDIAVLWGQRQRYEYFGFTRGGVSVKYRIGQANIRHALSDIVIDGLSFRPLSQLEDGAAFAHRLNLARPAYAEREAGQLLDLFMTFNQEAVGVLDDGRLIGYAVVNEAGNEVSEFAVSDPADIARTVKGYFAHTGTDGITIAVPEYDTALNASLARFAEECLIGTDYMYRIFDYANVLRAYLTLKQRTTGLVPGEWSAVLDGQPVTIHADEQGVEVKRSAAPGAVRLDLQHAQALLLTDYGRYEKRIQSPTGWFPLPVFSYKADMF